MLVEVRALTAAPFCRARRLFKPEWATFDLPPDTVEDLRRERFLAVRPVAAATAEETPRVEQSKPPMAPAPPPAPSQKHQQWQHGRRR
jgi:hypothetical protein